MARGEKMIENITTCRRGRMKYGQGSGCHSGYYGELINGNNSRIGEEGRGGHRGGMEESGKKYQDDELRGDLTAEALRKAPSGRRRRTPHLSGKRGGLRGEKGKEDSRKRAVFSTRQALDSIAKDWCKIGGEKETEIAH